MSIEFKDGAVCYADGKQWFVNKSRKHNKPLISETNRDFASFEWIIFRDKLNVNQITTGDFIAASELDTEQKYNDVVEVFGLFGFEWGKDASTSYFDKNSPCDKLRVNEDGLFKSDFSETSKTRKLTYNQIIAIGKLKRMMLDKVEAKLIDHQTLGNKVTANKYEREITDRQGNIATVDVYDVLKAFNVTCPATQHAVKKLLCSGLRGHKDLQTDLIEAKESIVRAIELN